MQKLSIQFFMLFCLSFLSFSASAQLTEDFEGSVPPTGWAIFDNGIGTTQSWQADTTANTGAQAASVRYESVTGGNSTDWLVTPAVNISAGASTLAFYQRLSYDFFDYGNIYTIRVSTTSQTDTTTFTTIDTQSELDFGTSYTPKLVDLSAYVGQSIYVAFVMEQNNGDNWFIDDLSIGAPPCLNPVTVTASNITTNSADISFDANGAPQAEVALVAAGAAAPTSGTVTSSSPFSATGLADGTSYDIYIRSLCSGGGNSNWVGPISFATSCLSVQGDVANDAFVISTPNFNQAGATDSCYTNSIGYSSADVWFQYVIPSCTDSLYIGLDSSDFDTYLRVYAADTTTSLATNDYGGAGSTSRLELSILNNANFSSGDTIYIVVEGYSSYEGNYVLDVQATTSSSPLGDWANTAFDVGNLPFATSNSTNCYNNSVGQAAADVWFEYVVEDCLDSIAISLAGSDYDSYLGIYAADSTSLLFSDDNGAGNNNAALNIPVGGAVNAGDTIYILVEGAATASGNFQLEVDAIYTPLVGNSIQEAISINGFPFSNYGSTTGNCYRNTIGHNSADVWFQHVLDSCTDTLFISLDSSDFDTYLRVYAADGVTQLDFNDDGGQGRTSALLLDVVNDPNYNAGDTIYILVEGYNSYTGNYGLNIDAVRCDPPVSATVVVNGLQTTYCNANNIPSPQMVIYNGGNSDLAMVPYTVTLSTLPFTIAVDTAYNIPMDDSVVISLPAFPSASGNGIFEVSIEVPGDYDLSDNVYTQVLAISNTVSTVSAVDVACHGDANGSATAMGQAGIAPYSYIWDANAGSQTTATATGLNPGTYNVTITDSIGCGTQNSIQVNEPTILTVDAVNNNDGTATANVSGGVASYSYDWSNGSTTATIQGAGLQTVIVTDANGCSASDTVTIVVAVTGIEGLEQMSIFPNPAQDYVNLSFELTESRQLQLQLVALNGQVVYTQSLNVVGQQNLRINTQELAPAMYMLRIIDEKSRTQHTEPIVIQR
ncbi:T9SS-dependent choice-of-anchor J family protein [Saprospira grandis]|nr:choice-of-anchor J domain-containing protein [Saprospira grandis]